MLLLIALAQITMSFASAASATGCELALGLIDARLTAPLKLMPALVTHAAEQDPALIHSLLRVFQHLDDVTLERLAFELIDPPPPVPEDELASNRFFVEHPKFRRPFADRTYAVLKSALGDRLTAYDRGLLAHLIPDVPRLDPRIWDTTDLPLIQRLQRERVQAIVDSDVYRPMLYELLHRFRESGPSLERVLGYAAHETKDPRHLIFDFDDVAALEQRLLRKRVNTREHVMIRSVMHEFADSVLLHTGWTEDDAISVTRVGPNDSVELYERADLTINSERFLVERLGLSEAIDRASAVINAIVALDPLPVSNGTLRAGVVTRAAALLTPIRLSMSLTRNKTAPTPPTVRGPRETFELVPVDHFAPRPEPSRIRARRDARAPAAPPTTPRWTPADISPDRALRTFTIFAGTPRPIDQLRAHHTYEFWYIRQNQPERRAVRFHPSVTAWFCANPAAGRGMLNALHMGESRGVLNGIKPIVGLTSRRHHGPAFEIKSYGSYRALMLMVDGVWQVVKIAQKNQVPRDVEWLTPLAEGKE